MATGDKQQTVDFLGKQIPGGNTVTVTAGLVGQELSTQAP